MLQHPPMHFKIRKRFETAADRIYVLMLVVVVGCPAFPSRVDRNVVFKTSFRFQRRRDEFLSPRLPLVPSEKSLLALRILRRCITASIIMQLLTIAFQLEGFQQDGGQEEEDQQDYPLCDSGSGAGAVHRHGGRFPTGRISGRIQRGECGPDHDGSDSRVGGPDVDPAKDHGKGVGNGISIVLVINIISRIHDLTTLSAVIAGQTLARRNAGSGYHCGDYHCYCSAGRASADAGADSGTVLQENPGKTSGGRQFHAHSSEGQHGGHDSGHLCPVPDADSGVYRRAAGLYGRHRRQHRSSGGSVPVIWFDPNKWLYHQACCC